MRTFVSYKSEDCNIVREVVEILISAGVSVWFAEYEVLPKNYDVFEQDLERNLNNAVSGCTHALVFTNNRWVESDYCRAEMKAINASIPAQNIIEFPIPHEELPHLAYPVLEHGPTLDYVQDPTVTAASILKLLGVAGTLPLHITAPCKKPSIRMWRFGLTLNTGPFKSSIAKSRSTSTARGIPSVLFYSELNGQMVELAIVLNVFDSVLRDLQISQAAAADDRKVYNGYRHYALKQERDASFNICGLHLFFWNMHSQLALTCVTPKNDSKSQHGFWERRYVISPRGMTPAERGELHFIFYVADIKGTPEEQFRKFTAMCPFFDQIMQTVQYRPSTASEDFINSFPMFFVRVLYLTICGWGAYALSSNPDSSDWLILLAMATGAMCAELALVLYSGVYRQILWTLGTLPLDDSFKDSYSRITINIPVEIMNYLVIWVMPYFLDLVVTLDVNKGTLRFPGPGFLWLVPIWFLLISYGYSNIGLFWSIAIGFLSAFIIGLIVVLRFICYRIHGVDWKDLKLR